MLRLRLPFALVLVGLVSACQVGTPAPPKAAILRIGVTPDSPPFVLAQDDHLTGLEVDFANELATALGRPVRFVALPWADQIAALIRGDTDVIMCGMTATRAREASMAFSDSYLRSGLLALVRRQDVDRYRSGEALLKSDARFGVVTGTTAERFVREQRNLVSVSTYATTTSAVLELNQRRIDAFVHDGPTVIWLASQNEAHLAPVLSRLNDEPLAWGVRRGDDGLRAALNGALARMESDGTRARILDRWIPYWRRLESGTPPPGRAAR